MSEEELSAELGLVDNQEVEQEEAKQDDVVELSAEEQRAWDQGWRPEAEFDGDASRWKTAREYNMYGEHQQELRSLKEDQRRKNQDFDERLVSVNKFHKAQMDSKIKDLQSQQRNAVESADTEEFDRIQTKIDDVKSQDAPVAPAAPEASVQDASIADWESKNSWINDGGQKANDAKAMWNSFSQSNPSGTIDQALAYVDAQINRLYPTEQPTNPRRSQPSMNERPSQQAPRRNNRELSMNDLTNDERQGWSSFGQLMYKNEKDFLKAVSDARKQ